MPAFRLSLACELRQALASTWPSAQQRAALRLGNLRLAVLADADGHRVH